VIVSGCKLEDAHADQLATALSNNVKVTELDVSFNNFTVKGGQALLKAVCQSTSSVHEVFSVGNKLEDDLEFALWDAPGSRKKANPVLDKKGQAIPVAPDTRKVSDIYNSLLVTQQREVEAKRRYAALQDEIRTMETKHALLTKSVRRLTDKEAQLEARKKELAADESKLLEKLAIAEKEKGKDAKDHAVKKKSSKLFGGKSTTAKINLKDIQLGEMLDKGGSGAVIYYAYVDGWQCVCKEMNLDENSTSLEYFEKEITLLENLPYHKNIVRYLFHETFGKKLRLFMTRYRSSLLYVLYEREQQKHYLSPDEARRVSLEIIRGLEFLHRHSIMHRDLKSDNIFVTLNERKEIAQVAIGDFDCAKAVSRQSAAKTVLGTAGFMAPEVWKNSWNYFVDVYSYKADIFSYGMVMFEILALQMPYSGINDAQIADCMRDNRKPELPAVIANDPAYAALIELHQKCISFNPLERPDSSQVKEALVSMRV